MKGFNEPWWFVAAIVWALAMAVLAFRQKAPIYWIDTHVGQRFRHRLTRYRRGWVGWHFVFLFVLGALLVAAAAGPFAVTSGERQVASRTVLIALDASLSMGATDVEPHPGPGEVPASRFAQGTQLAAELIEAMPDEVFGLITFSGVTVVHSPPTRDRAALANILETIGYHVDLTLSGTRFSTAFDALIHLVHQERGGYQVVLISDGELPQVDDYADALDVLAELGVPVHTIGVGSTEGEGRVIYEPEDVINSAEEKRVAKRYHTRREDSTLAAIAEATGGRTMTVAKGDWAGSLLSVIRNREPAVVEVEGKDKKDLSAYPLVIFWVGFLIETLIIARRPRGGRQVPDRKSGRRSARVQAQAVALVVAGLLLSGCRTPLRVLNAHYHNELGVGLHYAGEHSSAAARFEKSMSYRIRQHIPIYNLGNTAAAEEQFAVAHDYYQEAMLVEPRLVEAHYNDGHALYRWGEQEIDLEECVFTRAHQLMTQAAKRFRQAAELAGKKKLGQRALEDAEAVDARLAELDELIETCEPPFPPPPSCAPPPPPDPESSPPPPSEGDPPPPSEGDPPPPPEGDPPPPSEGDPPPPSEGDPPPPSEGDPPPSGGGGGGLSDDEKQEIQAALERIRQEAAGASGYRQSRHQQITEDTVGKASGMELWW